MLINAVSGISTRIQRELTMDMIEIASIWSGETAHDVEGAVSDNNKSEWTSARQGLNFRVTNWGPYAVPSMATFNESVWCGEANGHRQHMNARALRPEWP